MATPETVLDGVQSGASLPTPAVVEDTTPAAAAPGSEGQPVEQGVAAAPAFSIPENDDDLTGKETEPHVSAILNLRKELRERNSQIDTLKPLTPYQELGEFDVVKQYVDLGKAFFTPVMENGQPKVDASTGLQEITAAPAIEMLDKAAPGYVDNLLVDVLNSKLEDGSPRIRQVFQWYGLDPNRYEDYKNIDKLLAQVNGAVEPEELEKIPELYRDTYKTLPQSTRDDLQLMNPFTRESYLRGHKAEIEKQAFETSQNEREEQATQTHAAELQRQVQAQQLAHVAQVRKEEFDSIHQSLSDWKPSADESVNDLHRGLVMGALACLLDDDLRMAAEPFLNAIGVKLDSSFDDVINRFIQEDTKATAYEFYGSKMEANAARANASAARQQMKAKLSSIASQAVKKLDGSKATPPPTPGRTQIPEGQALNLTTNTSLPSVGTFSDERALQWARDRGIIK